MSADQLKSFWDAVQSDDSLQGGLANAANHAAVVKLAQEAGYSISEEDLSFELSEEELGSTAGGNLNLPSGAKKDFSRINKNMKLPEIKLNKSLQAKMIWCRCPCASGSE